MIPNTYKHVIPGTEMMKLSDAMKRIDLDSFVGEVLELILLNLRMEPSPGEEEMRYKLVLTINVRFEVSGYKYPPPCKVE